MLPALLQVQVRREHLLKCKYTTAQPGLQQRRIHVDEELQNLVRKSGHVGTLLKGWLQTSASPSLDMPGHRAVMWLTCFPRPCKCTLVGNSCSSSITNTTAQPGLQQRRLHADEELQNLVRKSGHAGTLLKGWLEASPSPSLDMPGGDVVDMLPVSLQV